MHFACGEIFNHHFLVTFRWKKNWKLVNIWWSNDKNLAAYFFPNTLYFCDTVCWGERKDICNDTL